MPSTSSCSKNFAKFLTHSKSIRCTEILLKTLSALELEVFTESKAIQIDNDVSFMTLEELEKEIDEIDRENKYQSTQYLKFLN